MVSSATITTTTAAQFLPALWSGETFDAVEFAALLQKRVNRSFEKDLKVGNTLYVNEISNLTTQTKSSGLDQVVAWEAITQTKNTITVSTHEYAAFLEEDIVKVQSVVDLRAKYTKKIGYALARGREVALTALFASLSTNTVGTLNVELTSDDYLTVLQKLGEAGMLEDDADAGDDFTLALTWAAYIDALKVDAFVNRQYNTAGDAIQRARIGDIYGLPAFRSNLLTANGAGHDGAAWKRDCFAMIVQEEVPVVSQYIIESLGWGVVGYDIYGVAECDFPVETPGSASKTDSHGVYIAMK